MQTTQQKAVKIFLLPAENTVGLQLFFLFSQNQVVEILQDVKLRPIPFSFPFVKGITGYNDKLIPVLSPEEMLGLKVDDNDHDYKQYVVIRSSQVNPATGENLQVVLATKSKLQLPQGEDENITRFFKPCSIPECIAAPGMIRAVFDNNGTQVVVLNIDSILLGPATLSQENDRL